MDRRQLDTLLPMLYGLAVVVCVFWVKDALLPVAVIGAFVLGIYYAVFRGRMARAEGGGRPRRRNS
jgi:mannose/fructose/N-acetylgalactosamine-specific phosphotransferase system component IID